MCWQLYWWWCFEAEFPFLVQASFELTTLQPRPLELLGLQVRAIVPGVCTLTLSSTKYVMPTILNRCVCTKHYTDG